MKRSKLKWSSASGYLFILPSLLLLILFHVIPIFMTAGYSFTQYNVLQAPEFIGLENYSNILKDPYITSSLFNTAIYTVIVVPIQTILSMLIAYLLARKFQTRFGGFVRSALFVPVITSMVLTAAVWRLLLSGNPEGVMNSIIGLFGIAPINWLGSRWPALIAVCLIAIWKNVGYFMVIFYTGMMDIPTSLYEAATVDGAGEIRQFFSVTLPLLKPITYLVVTLGTIWSFQVFDLVYTLTGGGPGRATMTLVLTIYNSAFKDYKMGYASAVSMLLLVIALFISFLQKVVFREKDGTKRRKR